MELVADCRWHHRRPRSRGQGAGARWPRDARGCRSRAEWAGPVAAQAPTCVQAQGDRQVPGGRLLPAARHPIGGGWRLSAGDEREPRPEGRGVWLESPAAEEPTAPRAACRARSAEDSVEAGTQWRGPEHVVSRGALPTRAGEPEPSVWENSPHSESLGPRWPRGVTASRGARPLGRWPPANAPVGSKAVNSCAAGSQQPTSLLRRSVPESR